MSVRFGQEYAVRYTELIPVLVKALNLQQQQIESLISQIENHLSSVEYKSLVSSTNEFNFEESGLANLQQNIPNPFNEITVIKYSIPVIESYAMINIYDLQGSQVKSFNVETTGDGELMVPASELNPGLYIYNLIVDGVEVSSKRMVLTE